jgi:transmembrane sensor
MSLQRQIDRLVALQAAEWFEKLRVGQDARENMQFNAWLAESPRHMDALLAVASESKGLRALFHSGRFERQDFLTQQALPEVIHFQSLSQSDGVARGTAEASPAGRSTDTPTEDPELGTRSAKPSRWVAAALAAGVIAAAATVGWQSLRWKTYETATGEQRAVHLEDGSVVMLNALSHLDVHMHAVEREIHLRGEALFKVARDGSRPFRVYTSGAVVQALGTQFNVYARADGTTTVSVVEGKVRISGEAQKSLIPLIRHTASTDKPAVNVALTAGEQAKVAKSGAIERPATPDVKAATAWQQRQLVFEHTALQEMAEQFNRYNAIQLRLESAELGDLRFTGAFDADDPESLAQILSKEPDLVVERRENEIVISRR